MTTYTYNKLEYADQIRVLELRPTYDQVDEIRGDLQLLRLGEIDHCECYDALSYTWGAPVFSRSVNINGQSIYITETLYTALGALCYARKRRRLWIDAVCINQKDDDEKASQVALMPRIYRYSLQVLAWVSEDNKEMEAAFQRFRQLADFIPRLGIHENIDHFVVFEKTNSSYASIMGCDDAASEGIERTPWGSQFACIGLNNLQILPVLEIQATARKIATESRLFTEAAMDASCRLFYDMPWFSRVWILQEVVSAPSLLLCCGKSRLEWEIFASAVLITSMASLTPSDSFLLASDLVFARGRRQLLNPIAPYGNAMNFLYGVEEPVQMSDCDSEIHIHSTSVGNLKGWFTKVRVLKQQGMLNQLGIANQRVFVPDSYEMILHIIRSLRRRQCADDRDRIYGALGIFPWELGIAIQPDYSSSVCDVYINWTRNMLQDGRLEILSDAGLWNRFETDYETSQDDTLPSWVPEYRQQKIEVQDSLSWYRPSFTYRWESCPAHLILSTETCNKKRLSIQGLEIGRIRIWSLLGSILQQDESLIATGQFFALTIAKHEALASGNDVDDDLFSAKLEMVERSFSRLLQELSVLRTETNNWQGCEGALERYTIFLTDTNRIGFVPFISKGDDIIVVAFTGLPGPYVIQEMSNRTTFRLMSPCYVDGLMGFPSEEMKGIEDFYNSETCKTFDLV
ncbi:heterokaryon incompatibility protein-domain-containing protein [Hyaloscypha sp. PMI_1271]|nr:heterokaryon incompatibility protein-domain-containing protein [Hyaloscypha sp. PMI_1271]